MPVAVVTALDLFLKKLILAAELHGEFLFFKINVVANQGIIGGYFSGQAKPVFQIPLVTLGFFLLVCLYFIQQFAPIKSPVMRLSISLFFGGVFANVIDRLLRGYVVDYLAVNFFGKATPTFNLADLFQYLGIVLMFIWQFFPSTYDDAYSKKLWVSRQFQKRYSLQLVTVGFFLILIFGVLSFSFVKMALDEISEVAPIKDKLMHDYFIFYASTSVTFLLFLYLIGKSLSAHVARPILNFEQYLRGLAAGDYNIFQVGEPEFKYLEKLSDDVRDHIVAMHLRIRELEGKPRQGPSVV